MKILNYIKDKGLKRAFVVLYEYKIDLLLQKMISIFYKKAPLKNVIIISSHDDFDCNGGAFYDCLIKKGYNQKYKIVWILEHDVPEILPKNVYAFKNLRPSIKKDYYICRAKIFTADNNIIKKVRKDQKSYYFTHGHGGFAIKNVVGLINIPDTVDFCLVSSHHLYEIESKAWSVPYPNNKMINLGFPSNDVLFDPQIQTKHLVLKNNYNLIILWMPTFRKLKNSDRNDSNKEYKFGIPLIESGETMANLKKYLADKNYCLIIKIHPCQDKSTYYELKKECGNNIIVLDSEEMKKRHIINQQLMIISDVMISDYSTAVFPFMLLNKPLGFILSDLKEYSLGLSISEPEEIMIGEKIYTYDDMIRFIDNVANGKDVFLKKRLETTKYLFDYVDGNSCERIIQHMGL